MNNQMCGTAGKLHWQPSLENNTVHKMTEHLVHRGLYEMRLLELEQYL